MGQLRILVLEDDRWLADSLAESLKNGLVAEAKTLTNPEDVFDVIDDWAPQVLVADLHLGAKNFLTLLNELQSYRDTRMMAKVILSSSGHKLTDDEVRQYGIIKVFDKATYRLDDLMKTIKEATWQLI